MPYKRVKVGKGKVSVRNAKTGVVHAKATTPAKEAAQERLLNAEDHGRRPSGVPAKRGSTPRELISKGLKAGKARKRRK